MRVGLKAIALIVFNIDIMRRLYLKEQSSYYIWIGGIGTHC